MVHRSKREMWTFFSQDSEDDGRQDREVMRLLLMSSCSSEEIALAQSHSNANVDVAKK